LPAPTLPPVYDGPAAFGLADELARRFPNRSPGGPGARNAADWVSAHLTELGLQVDRDQFEANVPGRGRLSLENIVAVSPGRSRQAIVVLAHRDNIGAGPGANDNASGTAAMIELARAHAAPRLAQTTGRLVLPLHTLVFLSSDGGAFGGLGAARFADHSRFANRIRAAIDLTAMAGPGRTQLHVAGDSPRSPPATLLRTAAARIEEYAGHTPRRPSAFEQLLDLAFPFSLYEQAPFVGRGIPALTVSTSGERPPSPFEDGPERLDASRLDELGHATQALVSALDRGISFEESSTHLQLGSRIVPGWAIMLVAGAALVPFLVAVADLLARSRRRGVRLLAPMRCYLRRLAFWVTAAVLFGLLGAAGLWEDGEPRPLSPESEVAQNWPVPELLLYGLLVLVAWLVARRRLLRRGLVTPKDELGGYTAALVVLAAVGVVTFLWNPFALILVLPSLHAWLWLPQLRDRPLMVRGAVLVAGFAGPLLLLGSFAFRFDLGFDAPWYVTQLAAVGYVPVAGVGLALVWAAAAAQFAALATNRYAPYPSRAERRRTPSVVRLAAAAAHETVGNAQSWRRMRARS
jgi:Peptidase family M28